MVSKKKIILFCLIITFLAVVFYIFNNPKSQIKTWGELVETSSVPVRLTINNSKVSQFNELICYTLILPLKSSKVKITSREVNLEIPQGLNQPNLCYFIKDNQSYRVFWTLPINDILGKTSLTQSFYSTEPNNLFSNFQIDELTKTVIVEQEKINYKNNLVNFKPHGRWSIYQINVDFLNNLPIKDNDVAFHTYNGAELFVHQWNGIAQEKNINSFLVNVWRHENAYKNCGEGRTGLLKNYFTKVGIPLNGNFEEGLQGFDYVKELGGFSLNPDGITSPQSVALFDYPECKFNLDRQEWLCSGKVLKQGEECSKAGSKFYYNLCNLSFIYTKIKPTLSPGNCYGRVFIDYTAEDGINPYPPVTAEEQNSIGRAISFSPHSGSLVVQYNWYAPIRENNKQLICKFKTLQSVALNETTNGRFIMFYERQFYLENPEVVECTKRIKEIMDINFIYPINTIIGLKPKN